MWFLFPKKKINKLTITCLEYVMVNICYLLFVTFLSFRLALKNNSNTTVLHCYIAMQRVPCISLEYFQTKLAGAVLKSLQCKS